MKKEEIYKILYEQNFQFCQNLFYIKGCVTLQERIIDILSELPLVELKVKNWDEINVKFERALTELEMNKIYQELKPSNFLELENYYSKSDNFNLNWIK